MLMARDSFLSSRRESAEVERVIVLSGAMLDARAEERGRRAMRCLRWLLRDAMDMRERLTRLCAA